MRISRHAVALIAAHSLTGVLGDFSGPSFIAPRDLTSSQSLVQKAWENITASLKTHLEGGTNNNNNATRNFIPKDARNTTFSIGLFSLHDPNTTSLQFHHTSPEIAASTVGTKKVDDNSIYRVASVTKVFTVLAGLLSLSDAEWERPLSKILAPLSLSGRGGNDTGGVLSTPWDKITMRALAAQIGGVPRDGFPASLGEIAFRRLQQNKTEAQVMAESGLPPASLVQSDPLSTPPCLPLLMQGELNCPATLYLQGVASRAPTFLPWSSPGYANNGFTLLGLAMSNVTNQNISQLFQNKILTPLSMRSSYPDPPPVSEYPRSVILGPDAQASGFSQENGIFVSSGGVFSTTNDLARFGTGILNSTLMEREKTRRWLKPVAYTARLQISLGAPWEILRYVHDSGSTKNKVTDLYTKLGDSGVYSSWLVLIPEYGFGFSILSAGSSSTRSAVVAGIADVITETVLPALQKQAAVEAAVNLGGTYTYPDAKGLNSTLVLKTTEGTPGMVISSWVSNGTDVLSYLRNITGPGPYRLLPSVDGDDTPGHGQGRGQRKVAFRLVGALDSLATSSGSLETGGLFSSPGLALGDWLVVDASTYYGAGLSLFVFDLGSDGRATAVTMPAYRVTLVRST